MKKTLVAIAALAATGAFAQVTITGNVDAGYRMRSGVDTAADKFSRVQVNNSSTTALVFAGNEDLGGGNSAGFLAEINWNPTQSQTTNGTAGAQYYVGTPFNAEQFIRLESKTVGKLRIGSPNSAVLETNGQAQPFGTAIGGGYMNTGVNRLGSASATGLGVNQYVGGVEAAGRVIRYERSVRYDTPVMSGFSASYLFSAKNGNSTTATDNQNGVSELGLKFSQGPLNLAYATTKITAGANAASVGPFVVTSGATAGTFTSVAGGTTAGTGLAANQDVKYTYAAANYNFGALTVYAGATTGKTGGGLTKIDANSNNIAAKYQVNGTLAVMANVLRVNDKTSDNFDAKLTGLGADYALSKRTTAYYRFEKADTKSNTAASGAYTTQAVGFRHSF